VSPALSDLPRYLVLNPSSTVRIELELEASSCEIDIELERPGPGPPGGPFVQRVRLSGKARVFFDPESPGRYELLLANPDHLPLTLHLRARDVHREEPTGEARPPRPTIRHRSAAAPADRRHRTPVRRKSRASARSRAA